MDKLKIEKLLDSEAIPYDLLLSADPNRDLVDKYLKEGECFVAKNKNSVIVGEYVLINKSDKIYEITNIAVYPKYQGKGYGKMLVLDAISRARDCCATKIEIGTGNSSLSQLALYQKCGFRIVGVYKNFFVNNYPEKIFENGIQCVDKVMLSINFISVMLPAGSLTNSPIGSTIAQYLSCKSEFPSEPVTSCTPIGNDFSTPIYLQIYV